jgi:ABC-type nickel/cobalt efflux system permease component RcnA
MRHHPGRDTMPMTIKGTHHARPDRSGRAARRRLAAGFGVVAALVVLLIAPAIAAAHPLGNFTINHYAGMRIEPDRVLLDVVIDQAEIPTFQARLDFDTDLDGEISDDEADAGRVTGCRALAPSLAVTVDGKALPLRLVEAGLTFPPGVGGLSTMRQVCGFEAPVPGGLGAGAIVTFHDHSYQARLGWREIVTAGSGVAVAASTGAAPLRATTDSNRLSAYPTDQLVQGLHDAAASVLVTPGGPALPPFDIPDATLVPGATPFDVALGAAATPPTMVATEPPVAPVAQVSSPGAVPGGVARGDLPSIFRTADLSPWIVLVSLLTAGILGAGHALTPGHGKTLMAAYLVGTRGTPLHAAGLGLSVTVSHTLGILALAALIVGAEGVLSPDVVVRAAPVVAAISIVAIGGWMLRNEVRRRRRARAADRAHAAAHEPGIAHDHTHPHDHMQAHDEMHAHDETIEMPAGTHSHGGHSHTHLPPTGSTITWRGLFALGLAGGLIPSTSALLILLGSIAAGRPAFGFVLVVAFGLGMAVVMSGIGLALVLARGRLDRLDGSTRVGRFAGLVPLAAACLVLALGFYLAVQAVAGAPTL